MKLILAVIQDEDANKLVSTLMEEGYSATKLASTGGFLRAGNTTLMIGVPKDKTEDAIAVIRKVCKTRRQMTTPPSSVTGMSGVYVPYPVEVTVGGATVFVLDVDAFEKI
jgi:uncharacterized protein YaaQ